MISCSDVNDLRMKSDESIEEFATRFIHLCCRFPLNDLHYINEWFQHLVSLSLEHDQSESYIDTHSQIDLEDLEVVDNQQFSLALFTLIDVFQEEHDISREVHETFDCSSPSSSSLILNRSEQSCHILENNTTILTNKEIKSESRVINMEQLSHSLTDDNQDQFMGDSIIDHPTDSPSKSIFESSHFDKSFNMISSLPFNNEHNFILNNALCSIYHIMNINQVMLREEANTQCSQLELDRDILIEEELSFENIVSLRDAFHFISSSSYYSLYPGVFNGCASQVIIPSYLEYNSTWPKSNKVQDGNSLYLGDGKNTTHSHEYFNIMPYPYSTWEEGIFAANIFHKYFYENINKIFPWITSTFSLFQWSSSPCLTFV